MIGNETLVRAEDHTFAICAYKESPYLEKAVSSVMQQSVLGNVLISTATPNDFINNIAKKYGIEVVHNTGLGTANGNWNCGYDASKTSYVTIVHQDDVYEKNYLESVLSAINGYPQNDILLVYTDYYEIREQKKVLDNTLLNVKRVINQPLSAKTLNGSKFIKRRVLSFGNPICCPSVTLHKKLVGNSPFDTTMVCSYDYKTWINIASKKGRFVYIPNPLVGHRIHNESGTTENILNSSRRNDDRELITSLWPRPIGHAISKVYSRAENSNEL